MLSYNSDTADCEQRANLVDPYFSGPEAGDNPNRHHSFEEFDRIKTAAELAVWPAEHNANR